MTNKVTRQEILDEAKKQVTGKRETDYGRPEDNFGIIAKLWSAYTGMEITPTDVTMMMSLLKIARIKTGFGGTTDCFVDLAGYAACGGEISQRTKEDGGNGDDTSSNPGNQSISSIKPSTSLYSCITPAPPIDNNKIYKCTTSHLPS